MRYNTITAIGTFSTLNGSVANSLMLVPERCTGGGDAPLRTTVEPAPSQDGALIEPPLDDAQIITLGGYFSIESGDRFTGSDTLLASLKTALAALKVAPGNLVHAGGTLKVWKYSAIEPSWEDGLMHVTFGLVVDVFA